MPHLIFFGESVNDGIPLFFFILTLSYLLSLLARLLSHSCLDFIYVEILILSSGDLVEGLAVWNVFQNQTGGVHTAAHWELYIGGCGRFTFGLVSGRVVIVSYSRLEQI